MAFDAINRVRETELWSKMQIDKSESDVAELKSAAEKKAARIISDAKEKAGLQLLHKEGKAQADADEILVTARNAAVITVGNLKRSCADKQQTVNKKILDILKNP